MGFHTNMASFPHRGAAWWRMRHMLQQEAMGKDLRNLADHKPLKARTNLILGGNQKYSVSRAMELSIPPYSALS